MHGIIINPLIGLEVGKVAMIIYPLKMLLSLSFLHLFSLIFSFSSVPIVNSFIYAECSKVYFDSMSSYDFNLNSLFTSLLNSSSLSKFNQFQISSSQTDNMVYGLFQCQGDLTYSGCQACVSNSLSQLKKTCPLSTGGTIQLEEGCFVKYDNVSFFGVYDKMEVYKRCGPPIGNYNSYSLNNIDVVLTDLIAGKGQYYRSGASGSVQGVAQCVQDLSVSDCEDCVLEARVRLGSACETTTWGDMFLGKCYIRYVFQPGSGNTGNNIVDDNNNNNRRSGGENNKSVIRNIVVIVAMIAGVTAAGFTIRNTYNIKVVNKSNSETRKESVEAKKESTEARKESVEAYTKAKEAYEKAEAARIKAKKASKRAKEATSTAASVRI